MPTKSLIDSYTAWAQGKPGLEPDVVDTVIDLKASYLGDELPGRWRQGDLSQVLLELIPRKVSADDEWYATVVPTVRSFLRFAADKNALHPQSAPVQHLLQELADIEVEFGHAVHDPSRFGMSKAIFHQMGLNPDAVAGDPEALQAVMDGFNALPFEERKAATDASLGTGPGSADEGARSLPAVRLVPVPELATGASSSPLWMDLGRLARWLGKGRKVTQTGVLTMAEVRSLAGEFRWPLLTDSLAAVRSARDVPELNMLWELAVETEVLKVGSTKAYPSAQYETVSGENVSDDAVLALWQHLFEAAVRAATLDEESPTFLDDGLDDAMLHGLMSSYTGEPHTIEDLIDEYGAIDEEVSLAPFIRSYAVSTLLGWLTPLAALGALEPLDDDDPGALVSLTPLGVNGVRQLVLQLGIDAPLAPDIRELPAESAYEAIITATADLSTELAREWFEAQGAEEATAGLLTLAGQGTAGTRDAVLALLNEVLDGGLGPLLGQLADPVLDVAARAFLFEQAALLEQMNRLGAADAAGLAEVIERLGDDAPELDFIQLVLTGLSWTGGDFTAAQRDLLAVESLARALLDIEPPVRTHDLPPLLWALVDDATLPGLASSAHPDAVAVLEAVGSGHPTGRVRRAAKKAAYKLRQRSLG